MRIIIKKSVLTRSKPVRMLRKVFHEFCRAGEIHYYAYLLDCKFVIGKHHFALLDGFISDYFGNCFSDGFLYYS